MKKSKSLTTEVTGYTEFFRPFCIGVGAPSGAQWAEPDYFVSCVAETVLQTGNRRRQR